MVAACPPPLVLLLAAVFERGRCVECTLEEAFIRI